MNTISRLFFTLIISIPLYIQNIYSNTPETQSYTPPDNSMLNVLALKTAGLMITCYNKNAHSPHHVAVVPKSDTETIKSLKAQAPLVQILPYKQVTGSLSLYLNAQPLTWKRWFMSFIKTHHPYRMALSIETDLKSASKVPQIFLYLPKPVNNPDCTPGTVSFDKQNSTITIACGSIVFVIEPLPKSSLPDPTIGIARRTNQPEIFDRLIIPSPWRKGSSQPIPPTSSYAGHSSNKEKVSP